MPKGTQTSRFSLGGVLGSVANKGVLGGKGLLSGLVSVTTDEVLEEQLRVGEIGRIVLEGLSVAAHEGLLEIGSEPDPLLHLRASEQVLALSNELVSAKLNVFVEKVATEHLLSVLVVDEVADNEERTESGLGDESHVAVVEHDVVVVQEQERGEGGEHHELFVVGVLDVQVGHVIIPLRVVGIEEHGINRELWSNALGNIKQIKHLLNRLVTLLAHTSADMESGRELVTDYD